MIAIVIVAAVRVQVTAMRHVDSGRDKGYGLLLGHAILL